MHTVKAFLSDHPLIKQLVHRLLVPQSRPRPRAWVRHLLNPLWFARSRKGRIARSVRMDVFPFNPFSLGTQSTIEDFSTVNNGVGAVEIGDHSRVGCGNTLIGPVKIGHRSHLAQNVVMSGLNHNYADVSKPLSEQGTTTAQITIGDDCWIGANVSIVPGVNIGDRCVIGAGSVVTKSIPAFHIAVGNPAKPVKRYDFNTQTWIKL